MRITDVLAVLSGLLWVGAVGAIVLIAMQSVRGKKIKNSPLIIIGIILFALIVTTLSAGLVFIEPQERGVVISALAPKGYWEQALQPG